MLSDEAKLDLGVALNEASLVDLEVHRDRATVVCMLEVLTLPVQGPEPEDRTVALLLRPVGRLAASLRLGRWDDDAAPVASFGIDDLGSVVRSFGGQPIYGWEFIDPSDTSWPSWRDRLSLDERLAANAGDGHVIELFQESLGGPPRHLDLRIWFDTLHVVRRDGTELQLDEFIAGGLRWWEAMRAGDPRTQGHGIVPGGPSSQ